VLENPKGKNNLCKDDLLEIYNLYK